MNVWWLLHSWLHCSFKLRPSFCECLMTFTHKSWNWMAVMKTQHVRAHRHVCTLSHTHHYVSKAPIAGEKWCWRSMSFHYQPIPFGTVGILHNQPVSFGTCVSLDSCFPCTFVLLFSLCSLLLLSSLIPLPLQIHLWPVLTNWVLTQPAYCATGKSSQWGSIWVFSEFCKSKVYKH